jgi:hypothetical protein
MAIMLEECSNEEQRSAVLFLWAKELNARNVHKNISYYRWEAFVA